MPNHEKIKSMLADENPDALLLDGFDEALVGYARRCGQPTLAVYDYALCVDVLVQDGMSHEEAVEYFEYNVASAWMGEHTPVIVVRPDE